MVPAVTASGRAGAVDDARLLVEEGINALRGGEPLLHLARQVAERADRLAAISSAVTNPMKSPTVETPLAMRQ